MLFDRIALRAFCNSVDLRDQQELFRAFSRAREKATQINLHRTNMTTLFSSNSPKKMQSCSRFLTMYLEGNALLSFGQDDVFF